MNLTDSGLSERSLFFFRLHQFSKEPLFWVLIAFSLVLTAISTVFGPLPRGRNGQTWLELGLASVQFTSWLSTLLIAGHGSGSLLKKLWIFPISRPKAYFYWLLSDYCLLAFAFFLPSALCLACLYPELSLASTAPFIIAFSQTMAFCALGLFLRDHFHFPDLFFPIMALAWLAASLPPLSWASPRLLSGNQDGEFLFLSASLLTWMGIWFFFSAMSINLVYLSWVKRGRLIQKSNICGA